jgi:hypothetical protein
VGALEDRLAARDTRVAALEAALELALALSLGLPPCGTTPAAEAPAAEAPAAEAPAVAVAAETVAAETVAVEAAAATEAAPGARRVVQRTQAYWARRVWVFLSKVRELKSVPKDEKRLGDPAIVKRWAA